MDASLTKSVCKKYVYGPGGENKPVLNHLPLGRIQGALNKDAHFAVGTRGSITSVAEDEERGSRSWAPQPFAPFS